MNITRNAFQVIAPERGNLVSLVEREKIRMPSPRGSLAVMKPDGTLEMSYGPLEENSRSHTVTQKGNKLIVDGTKYKARLHVVGQDPEGEDVSLYSAEQARMGLAGKTAAVIGFGIMSLLPNAACKGPSDPDIPKPVTFYISVYDHMKAGVQRTLTKEGASNSAITIQFSEVAIGDVSQLYMAAREPNMGARLGTTTNGVLGIQTSNSTSIDVYCFSTGDGVQESYFQDIMTLNPELKMGRDSHWYRRNFDGRTPNNEFQSNFETVFSDCNNALWAPFRVGSCMSQGGVSGADFSYGCKKLLADGDKDYDAKWVCVDNEKLYNIPERIQRTAMAEIWEALAKMNNIGGNPSQMLVCDGSQRLNDIGKSLLRFAYIMAP
ncbi:MAG: hypothetical protein V1866_04420 [archaeon]